MTSPNFENSDYQFFAIAQKEDLPEGERLFLEINGASLVVFNILNHLYAIRDVCSHDDGPLGDGELEDYEIICPRHGARFDVRTGKVLAAPAFTDIDTYPVIVEDDQIKIGLPKNT